MMLLTLIESKGFVIEDFFLIDAVDLVWPPAYCKGLVRVLNDARFVSKFWKLYEFSDDIVKLPERTET